MEQVADTPRVPPLHVAICVEGEVLDRLGIVLRHLTVGLVDQAVRTRLVSSDRRIEGLALGPIQTIVHQPIRWPVSRRRTEQMIEAFGHQPPTIVHAMSEASYRSAAAIAEHYDADLLLQLSSLADCAFLEQMNASQIARIVAFSDRLAAAIPGDTKVFADRIEVIRAGVQTFERPACFARPERVPSVVCTAPLEKASGIHRVIEAAEILRKRGRRAMFFLLGQGSQESALRRQAREHEVAATVTFAQPAGDATSVMTSADLFVCPHDDGAFRADGLQAMGAGLAVVAVPDSSGEHFRHLETAFVCKDDSATAIAGAVEELLQDRALAQRLAATALEFVRSHHSMSSMAERFAALYRGLALARSTFSIGE